MSVTCQLPAKLGSERRHEAQLGRREGGREKGRGGEGAREGGRRGGREGGRRGRAIRERRSPSAAWG